MGQTPEERAASRAAADADRARLVKEATKDAKPPQMTQGPLSDDAKKQYAGMGTTMTKANFLALQAEQKSKEKSVETFKKQEAARAKKEAAIDDARRKREGSSLVTVDPKGKLMASAAEKTARASEKTAKATQQTAQATTDTNKAIDKGAKGAAAKAVGPMAAVGPEKDYRTNPVVSTICGNLKMASGGRVPGYGAGDTIPAMLTPGEFVMNKDASRQHEDLLRSLNSNRFATGGIVPPAGLGGGGGGGGGPSIALNVRGDSVNSIMKSVATQLGSTLNKMMSPSGTGGRYFDLSQSG
jgi:hypothetical protein